MKRNVKKRISSLLLSLLLTVGLTIPAAAADSTVTYTGHDEFEFAPGSSYTETDLFENFKGVMPGDVLTETITVKNEYRGSDYVKVYMTALLHDEKDNPISPKVLEELEADDRKDTLSNLEYMHDFLAQLTLTVWNGEKKDANKIYEGHPNSLDTWPEANDAGYTYLGKLTYNQSLELTAELSVPLEMGNDYADRIGEVDWVIVAEGFDDSTSDDDDTYLTVRKVWVDDGVDRPDSVTVHLLKNGEKYAETTLNANNQWTYTWDNLNDKYTWTVKEAEVPTGYEVSYSVQGNVTTITNTEKDPTTPPTDPDNPTPVDPTDPDPSQPTDPDNPNDPDTPTPTDPTDPTQPDSPKTGDETNIWPYVGLLGVCLLALCWLFLTRKKKTEED